MGKSKSSRRQNRRHDPVTGTEGRITKGSKQKETDPDSTAVFEAVLQQVTSEDSSNRSTGLTSISIIASQKQHLTVLKNPTILKAIVPLLLDSALQNIAAGTLRNLSSVDSELCGMLVEENIMDKVSEIVRDTFATWTPSQESILQEETLVQCVALLWNLCESTPSAVQIATQNNLHASLTRYLDWNVFGLSLASTVAHCLYTLTEDNKNLTQTQQLSHALAILLQDSATPPQLVTPALGTLLNISSADYTKLPQPIQDSFFHLITSAIEPNFIELVNKLSSDLPVNSLEFNAVNEKTTEEINTILATGKTALEILSNVICADDDSSDAASDNSDAMDCDEEDEILTSTLPIHLFANLSAQLPTLLPLILQACRPIPVNVHGILLSNKLQRLLNNLSQIRATGLISLQNLFESLPLDVIEKAAPTGEVLSALLKILQNVESIETDILESVTSSIRSLLTLWSSEKKIVQDLTNVVQPFLELYQKSTVDRIKINAIKILGSVYLLSNDLTLLKEMGLFMKQILSAPVIKTNLLVIVELVDTLMDIFAEDDSDPVLGEIGLVGRLKSLTGEIKKVSRMERRTLAMEQKAVVQTVLENLPRFVEYKTKILK